MAIPDLHHVELWLT